jgi:predicted Zn-dependent protease with MMP-like domain
MTRSRFEQLVTEAMTLIPKRFRREMRNLAVIVDDDPHPSLLDDMGIEPPDTLFGLYQGTPLPERSAGHGNSLPDVITLYQLPIEEECDGDEDEVRAVIGETLIHEVGHHFGLSEEEIEAIEEHYWRGGTLGPDEDEDDSEDGEDDPGERRGQ